MKKKQIYIANWKSYLSYDSEILYLEKNFKEISSLSDENNIILCPSFVSISKINDLINNKLKIKLGAQNCSNFETGAYTGEISAISLSQINCDYCIVGHSERRTLFNETDEQIYQKINNLIKNKIIPILCIGETKKDQNIEQIKEIIEKQLDMLKNEKYDLIIAYEPVWAIGTGIIPTTSHIEKICQIIENKMAEKQEINYQIIYGGSINEKTASELKRLKKISGFLIGKASTDFQEFKKIVLL